MMRISHREFNGIICSLFLLQYTFLIPFMRYVSSTLLVAAFGLLLLLILLMKNGLTVNRNIYVFYLIFLLVIVIKVLISDSSLSVVALIVLFTLPSAFVMSYEFDYDAFMHFSIKLSKVCFVLICWIPFASGFNYMRFGYGMLPVIIFSYLDLLYFNTKDNKYNKLNSFANIAIIVLGSIEMLMYGARGSVLSLMLFVVLDRFLVNRAFSIKNILLAVLGLVAYLNIVPLLDAFERLSKKIGIYSYAITKFKMQLRGGFEYASSGRDILYAKSIAKIKEHPILGNKIVLDETGGDYVHNLFLQVAEDLGIVFLIILIVFLIYVLYKIGSKKTTRNEKIILSVLFAVSIGRLMFSSTIWRRPEFWMMACFCLAMRSNRQIQTDHSPVSQKVRKTAC